MLELQKLGAAARNSLYIQLATSPNHYLVIVMTDEQFRFALISTKTLSDTMFANLVMEDIAWLDVDRIQGDSTVFGPRTADNLSPVTGQPISQRGSISDGSLPIRYVGLV